MKKMTSNEIRQMWLDFFKSKGHDVEEGASLVPSDDKSLLWMNAGVTPLKKYFDGRKIPKNPRICNAQKCIRTNDIENVGKTSRHHTFFEMLGNFSIGDYFRNEVIPWAFELLTSEEWFGFDKNKLYITYYPDDKDTLNLWIKVGMDPSHMVPCKDNFWEIGSGPCGPDTEIFYDRGSEFGDFTKDAIADDIENDRYIEIWNIVFSQYNSDGSGDRANYKLLPKKNIDTGSGLERIASVMQGARTNFETDLFMPIIAEVEKISSRTYDGQASFKIIADHVRTIVFALSDGALFSNEGRGYVLRRLLRRGVKHGISLGLKEPFMYKLVDIVTSNMGGFYPNLKKSEDLSKMLIKREEEKFFNTLDQGLEKLNEIKKNTKSLISGSDAFLLYDTYGFPIELTEEYASEDGLTVDKEGFKKEMELQKERARNAQSSSSAFMKQNEEYLNFLDKSEFTGYETLKEKAKIIKVFEQGFVTDKTPFYAICGGQVGDTGEVIKDGVTYSVIDTLMLPHKQHLHVVENPLIFNVGDGVELIVDEERREALMKNHSCTHLMFKALRTILGDHISQQGSEVTPETLRFDFNHFELLKENQILEIEKLTNEYINKNSQAHTDVLSLDEAREKGAIAEFGEKYEDKVRVVNLGSTIDVCGGTHVRDTKDIEKFMVVSLSSIGSGLYRITGLTSSNIADEKNYLAGYYKEINNLKEKVISLKMKASEKGISIPFDFDASYVLKGSYEDIINLRNISSSYQNAVKAYEKDVNRKIDEKSITSFEEYRAGLTEKGIVLSLVDFDKAKIRQLADYLSSCITSGVIFILNEVDAKLQFVVKNSDPSRDAKEILSLALSISNGTGGGKKEFAQGGSSNVSQKMDVVNKIKEILDL